MKGRETFVAERRDRWERLDTMLRGVGPRSAEEWSETASLYRSLCADLAAAQSLEVAEDVRSYLDDLAGRAHNALYGARAGRRLGLLRTLMVDFPREVRRSWPFFVAAFVLFYGPFFVGVVGPWLDPSFAAAVLPESQLAGMEAMYSEEIERQGGQDAMMTGFYVRNNIGIALRCFATGALLGLGPVFFLVYNGLVLGTVFGHLTASGLAHALLTFTAGHGSWELMGIVISGMAGLRLGWAIIGTEGLTRGASLRRAGPALYHLVVGAIAMIAVAAVIEGLWSASPIPPPVKWAFGIANWGFVAIWFLFGGRRADP